jgi:hypothetical protein
LIALPAIALPSVANADIPITGFAAGPVPVFNNPGGFPVDLAAAPTPANTDFNCITPAGTLTPLGTPAVSLSTQAGATTDFCVNFTLNPGPPISGEDMHDSLIGLPVGSLAAIDNATKCSDAQFAREVITPQSCPPTSQVGTAFVTLVVPTGLPAPNDTTTKKAPGRIFALDTPADKAAKFGVALIAQAPAAPSTPYLETKFTITVSQLGVPTIGLQNQTDELSKTVGAGTPIAIAANALRFWGKAADHPHYANPFAPAPPTVTMASDFFRVGTTCQTPQTVNLTVNPWTNTAATAGSLPTKKDFTYQLTGCDKLPFNPGYSINLTGDQANGSHPGLAVKLTNAEGNADFGGTKITLPAGITVDLKNVQNACPQATFEAGNCSADAVAGTTTAKLSGINPDVVKGDVILVQVAGQTLPALGLNYKGRLPLRIAGLTTIDSNGQVVNTFSNIPSIPQRELQINLNGGAKGLLVLNGNGKCTASAYTATLTSQNGQTANFNQPTKCAEQFTATLTNPKSTKPRITIGGAGATGKKINTLRITLPSGLNSNPNTSRTGWKIKNIEPAVKGPVKVNRLSQAKIRFTIAKPGSNGLSILSRTGTLKASKSFAKSTKARTVAVRVVYTDGTKVVVAVPLTRKS